jgi:hypothetical protein
VAAAEGKGAVFWDAAKVVAEVKELRPAAIAASAAAEEEVAAREGMAVEEVAVEGVVETDDVALLTVSVALREVYWAKRGDDEQDDGKGNEQGGGKGNEQGGGKGRRSCLFRIEFRRKGAAAITRGETSLWQARVCEALDLWAGTESRSSPGGAPGR